MKLGERLLRAVSRAPDSQDYVRGTLSTRLDTALDFLIKTVPGFLSYIRGKNVLDYGSGWGWQAVAMVNSGAQSVFGLEIVQDNIERARELVAQHNLQDRVIISDRPPDQPQTIDVALSCSSFEHFSDPVAVLDHMASMVRPGGRIIISFAEPWYSPRGSHMDLFTKCPWVNLLWSEATVMKVRSSYRNDGATRYEDVQGGLNRMSLAKFENILSNSPLEVEWVRYYSTKGIPFVHKVPVIRELLTSAVATCLRKRESDEAPYS